MAAGAGEGDDGSEALGLGVYEDGEAFRRERGKKKEDWGLENRSLFGEYFIFKRNRENIHIRPRR